MNPFLRQGGKNWYTRSLVPKQRVYGEKLIHEDGVDWREWNPFRSKLAAGLCSGLKDLTIAPGQTVLYLGSAEGTTVSHVSDLVGEEGVVVGVDISPQAMRSFTRLTESRSNILPLLADANHPEELAKELGDFSADVIIQDVAQKNQADIFLKNWKVFAHSASQGFLIIKSRSIDFSMDPSRVVAKELVTIKKHASVEQVVDLGNFERSHFLLHVKSK